MKKISFKMPAFSLAEALITLLIVCLITLASIPILTKKKRTANNGVHGTWMCTWNSERKLVHWSSSEPKGDVNKPDTWAEGCNFVPPVNASVFNITAIGAGGTGGTGETQLEDVANTDKAGSTSYFTPQKNAKYRILVAGAGGSGGGGIWRSDSTKVEDKYNCDKGSCGTGGAGASGAYILADVPLKAGYTYAMEAGTAGAPAKCHFNKSTKDDPERGATGGDSVFRLNTVDSSIPDRNSAINTKAPDFRSGIYANFNPNSLKIIARGGQGGERIEVSGKGCCSDFCRYGLPGTRRSQIRHENERTDVNILSESLGTNGVSGGCAVVYSPSGTQIGNLGIWGASETSLGDAAGGKGFDARIFGLPSQYSNVGHGGKGTRPKFPKIDGTVEDCFTAGTGANGNVSVYEIKRMQGLGGEAAKPEERLSMSIKGKVKIQVGNTYGKNAADVKTNDTFDSEKYQELRTTKVIIYDKHDRETKRIVGYPGNDGKQVEGTSAQKGFDSYLTEKGGGRASTNADCEATRKEVLADKIENIYPVCKNVICKLNIFYDDSNPNKNDIDGYTVGSGQKGTMTVLKEYTPLLTSIFNSDTYKDYLDKISYDYFRNKYPRSSTTDPTTGQTIKTIKYSDILVKDGGVYKFFKKNDDELSFYYNYNKSEGAYSNLSEDSGVCFDNGELRYTKACNDQPNPDTGEYGTVKKITGGELIGYEDTYTCKPGVNADRRAFGAGGGGGYAHEHPGVTSAGGLGAPGAVIIEW